MTATATPTRSPNRHDVARHSVAIRLALGTASALGLARFAYGLLLPAMRSDLHWSLAQAGVMTSANGAGYLIGAAITAFGSRRWTATVIFRAGMLIIAVTLATTAASNDYSVLLISRAAAGIGGALVFIAGGVIVSRKAAATRSATPITIYFSGAGLGVLVSGALLPLLLDRAPYRWPIAWIGLAVLAALATAVSWTAARSEEPASHRVIGHRNMRRLWRTAAAYLLFASGYIAYITFLSVTFITGDAPPWKVALLWTLLGISAMTAPWAWIRPFMLWPPTRILTLLLLLLASASILPLISAAPAVLAVSVLTYGASFMTVPAAVTACIRITSRPEDWASTLATFTMLFAAGQTIGPWAAGIIADHTAPSATLVWTAGLCTLAALIAAIESKRTTGPHREAAAEQSQTRYESAE